MYMRGQARVVEAQTEDKNQLQLATTTEITELRQVVQQQAELMQKQIEESKKREEELTHHQNDCLRRSCKDFQSVRVRTNRSCS